MNSQQPLIKMRWLTYVVVTCAVFFFIGCLIVGSRVYPLFYRPMMVGRNDPVIIQIDKSTSAASFVHKLSDQQMIHFPRLFLLLIRMQGLSHQLKAGVYQIRNGESAEQFLYRVVAGDVLIESFRIIEGMTQAQVSANLEHAAYLTYQPSDWQAISATLPSAEGLLLADTYHYNAGSQSKSLLERAHENLQKTLEITWQERQADLPYRTSYELLIVASIIEKEAAIPAEKRLISGVIINRLRQHMPLQMDPTVIYALGPTFKGKLTREDLRVDSPYNSYRYRGLPPTPIAMVGKDAIDAAAHPAPTKYLYFVARGDGSHYFSVNYDEQKQAVARYQK